MLRSYEYRIYPSQKQEARLYSTFHLCTELHNFLLTVSREEYEATGRTLRFTDCARLMVELKQQDTRFQAVYSQVLQQVGRRLMVAYENFFRRCQKKKDDKSIRVGFPRYKKLAHSICYPQNNGSFKLIGNKLHVSKLGDIPIVLHRPLSGTVKTLTIKRNMAGQFFAVFSCEIPDPVPSTNQGEAVGIDQGLSHLLVSSDGLVIDPPKYLRQAEKRLKKYQRRVSRKKKGSNNRKKARKRLAKLHLKVTNQRNDFLHQVSRRLANEYSMIAVEDLQLESMVKNHHVAKSFNDAGLGTLVRMLGYKVSETGSQLFKVEPAYTTQTCSRCGQVKEGDKKLGLNDRVYHCPCCGLNIDRDLNAARNILTRAGLVRSHACGDDVRPSSEKAVVAEAGTRHSARGEVGSPRL